MSAGWVVGVLGLSTLGGAFIGMIAGSPMHPVGGLAGAVMGFQVGLLLWPLLMLALWRKPLDLATAMMLPPAALTALLAGGSKSPAVALLSVVVFCAMGAVAHLVLADLPRRVPQGSCRWCGYDKQGLERCPECGLMYGAAPRTPLSRDRRALVWAVLLLGVLAPMVVAWWCGRSVQ